MLHQESFEQWKDYFNDFIGEHAKQHWIKAVGTVRGALQDTATKRPYKNVAAAIRAIHQEEGGQMTSDTVHLLRLYDKSSQSHTFTNMQQAVKACKKEDGHLEPQVATAILVAFNCSETHKAVHLCVAEHKKSSAKTRGNGQKQQMDETQPTSSTTGNTMQQH